jgi:DNA-binding transcriptional regulator GbsR (MarR family)
MANYTPENVLHREKPGEVFAQVCLGETYASEITEETGIDRSMVSEILSSLEKKGFITVSRRSQAKYYVLDQHGIAEHVIEQFTEAYSVDIFGKHEQLNFDEPLKREELNSPMADFIENYLSAKYKIERHDIRPADTVSVDELTSFFIYAFIYGLLNSNGFRSNVDELFGVPEEVTKLMFVCIGKEGSSVKKYKKYMSH